MRLTKYFYLILLVLMTASLEPINGQGLNPDSLALVAFTKAQKAMPGKTTEIGSSPDRVFQLGTV
jgi:hypothetical protein